MYHILLFYSCYILSQLIILLFLDIYGKVSHYHSVLTCRHNPSLFINKKNVTPVIRHHPNGRFTKNFLYNSGIIVLGVGLN